MDLESAPCMRAQLLSSHIYLNAARSQPQFDHVSSDARVFAETVWHSDCLLILSPKPLKISVDCSERLSPPLCVLVFSFACRVVGAVDVVGLCSF